MTDATPANRTTDLVSAAITIAGSEAKLGKMTGYSQNAVWRAKRIGRVSAEMAAAIHRATNGAVTKQALRPDIYGYDETSAAAA